MAHVSPAVDAPSFGVNRLSITSGARVVVRDLTFSVAAGTLLWITGENGAGKSSLLRVLAARTVRPQVRFSPVPTLLDIAFYAPPMGVPANVTVEQWLAFSDASLNEVPLLDRNDALLPSVQPGALLTRLSTGETKRLLLWALLRADRPYTFLDEPYEHLSPAAKTRLTHILSERALTRVVVVATNQDIPAISHCTTLDIGAP